jgi:hypothetical protein
METYKGNHNDDNMDLLAEYIDIKCTQYKQYNDFITDFKISFEKDGRLNFTVLTNNKFPPSHKK